jgi:hypothetical protein
MPVLPKSTVIALLMKIREMTHHRTNVEAQSNSLLNTGCNSSLALP